MHCWFETDQNKKLAKLIGKLVAAFPASMYGPLYFRNLEKD